MPGILPGRFHQRYIRVGHDRLRTSEFILKQSKWLLQFKLKKKPQAISGPVEVSVKGFRL
jgi:hypothetical protein